MSWENTIKKNKSGGIDPHFVIWLRWKYEEEFNKYMDEYKRQIGRESRLIGENLDGEFRGD